MSLIAFAGAAQFAAIGYVVGGHRLARSSPSDVPAQRPPRPVLGGARAVVRAHVRSPQRAAMAHLLTDEAFALSIAHFRRIGRFDASATGSPRSSTTLIPWNLATLAGRDRSARSIVDPRALGIDVIFPAAMAGLAVGLITGRRELVAAMAGAAIGGRRRRWPSSATAGVIAGGVIGPLVGLLVPAAMPRVRRSAPRRRPSATRARA